MIKFFELEQGGEKIAILTKNILFLKEVKSGNSKGTEIHLIVDMSDPFFVQKPLKDVLDELAGNDSDSVLD